MLRQGLGVTWGLAAVGATGRVVVPILLQQAIDQGIVGESGVDLGFVAMLAVIGAVALFIASLAQRTAVVRLGRRSEQALYLLRARLIAHIHRLSLADHNEERRGALVARVTSDIETLAQFFQWGGLAWLLDGPLMLMVAGRDARLRLDPRPRRVRRRGPAGARAARRATPPRQGLRRGARAQRRDAVGRHRGRHRLGDGAGLRRRRHARSGGRRRHRAAHQVADQGPGDRRLPVPVGRGVLGAHRRRRDRRRRRPRPGQRADGRGDDRLHLPDLPVPRTDRRVHRGPRPDPDGGGRVASGARRARPPRRPAAARVAARPAARPARHRRPRRHVLLPDARRHGRGRRGRAAPRQRAHPGRPAGGHGRRHRLRQDDARAADRPLRRSDDRPDPPRRRAAARRRQRRAAAAARRGVAGAVPVRRHDRRQHRLRPPRDVGAGDGRGRRPASMSATGWRASPTA